MREYKAKSGRTLFAPSMDEIHEMDDGVSGWCLACGEIVQGVEPDAVRYTCECCGEDKVYGPMELVMRGLVKD